MSLEQFAQWGGKVPRIYDPREIPPGKAVLAKNCRFDHGGVLPLQSDTAVATLPNAGPILTLFLYQGEYWFAWASDVDAVLTPTPNDQYKRVYYTENGTLKVTDSTLFNQGGAAYPEKFLLPSPPAPFNAPTMQQYPLVPWPNIPKGLPVFLSIHMIFVSGGVVSVQFYSGTASTIGDTNAPVLFHSTGIPALDGNIVAFSGCGVSGPYPFINLPSIAGLITGALTAVTAGAPPSATAASHGLITGDAVLFSTPGMAALDGHQGSITVFDVNTFTIVGIDTTGEVFTSGTFTLVSRTYGATYIWPAENLTVPVAISVAGGDTISRSNPCAIKHTAHVLVTGDCIGFSDMVGMTPLVDQIVSVTVVDANNFTLDGVNSSSYPAFVSGSYIKIPTISVPRDPTQEQSRYYVETYVNQYGDEGPPTAASAVISVYDGDTVMLTCNNVFATLAAMEAAVPSVPGSNGFLGYVTADGANNGQWKYTGAYVGGIWHSTWTQTSPDPYGISFKNFYRSNIDDTGAEVVQFLVQLPLATVTFQDNIAAAALGEILATSEWDAAPQGVTGLIGTPNEGMACYIGNTICLAVPGFPHAWPASYQKAVERDIMGLLSWGTTVVALTEGLPEAVTFTDPVNSVPEKLESGFSCSSKRSLVDMLTYFMYASPEGLVEIGPSTPGAVVTADLFSREDWAAYQPATISGYLWEGRYVGFYGGTAGFIFDPATKNFVDLDFFATAGYRDPATGILYLQVGTGLVSFATATVAPRSMDWKGGWKLVKLTQFSAIKVLATSYPVVVDVCYPLLGQTFTVTVVGPRPQRLPQSQTMVDSVQLRVYGTVGATVVYLASSLEELPQ